MKSIDQCEVKQIVDSVAQLFSFLCCVFHFVKFVLSMFLDCPFSIPHSVFSNVNDVVDKNNNDKFDISLVSKSV